MFTSSAAPLTPDATPGVGNVCEFTDGSLRLASILPDGTPATEGAFTFSNDIGAHIMSGDGSRLLFQTGASLGDAPLYVRSGGVDRDQRVAAPWRSATPQPVRLRGATPDGRFVYFTSTSPLTTGSSSVEALYRYDVDTGMLMDISSPADLADASWILTGLYASDDGHYVYFRSQGS